jgi:proteic killer suppression protein
MMEGFRHRGLRELFETGRSARVRPDPQRCATLRLDALEAAASVMHLRQPGSIFTGYGARRYSIHESGPWGIPFESQDSKALHVDLELYH